MPLPRPLRRILSPVIVLIEVTLVAVFVVAAVVGLVVAPFDPRRRLLRLAAFGVVYFAVELVGLGAAAGAWFTRPAHPRSWWEVYHFRLLTWTLGTILAAAQRCFGFVVIVDKAARTGPLDEPDPVLVLARHGGLGDSFALVWLLLARQRWVRVVLKDVLQWEPLLDVLLNRLGACFLPSVAPNGEELADRLEELASKLGDRDALLLFPEGGNWTPSRWTRALRRLRLERKFQAAAAAALMPNVLPPRPAGVGACLDGRPGLAVVVVAHTGLDNLTTVRQTWDALPFEHAMTVRWWRASPAPDGDEARLAWLTTEWAVVDEWIDANRPGEPDRPTEYDPGEADSAAPMT